MNLHAVVASQVGAVNQNVPLVVRVSTGGETTSDSGVATPEYATPGSFQADFDGFVMTVATQAAGKLQAGQRITGTGVKVGTVIVEQTSGPAGGLGDYKLNVSQDELMAVDCEAVFVLIGQVQPMGWKDLQQIDGLNLQGTIRKAYLYGQVEAIVRADGKSGDLITDPSGKVWLVNNVLEDWTYAGWCAVVVTLQNGE